MTAPALPDRVRVSNGPLLDPSGRPLHRVPVTVSVVAPSNPFLLNGSGAVIERLTVDTGRTGVWTADLLPQDAYSRTDTYYIADETKIPGGAQWLFTVPSDGGPYSLEELLIAAPPTGGSAVGGRRTDWTHTQLAASSTWVIEHNLGYPPGGVTLIDSDGGEVEAELIYTLPDTVLTVSFPYDRPISGKAYLS